VRSTLRPVPAGWEVLSLPGSADLISWRVGFFINVPIGIAMILAAPRFLPETERVPGRLDVSGALSSTLGMTALVYGIVRSADAPGCRRRAPAHAPLPRSADMS
jgi:MFS family permease